MKHTINKIFCTIVCACTLTLTSCIEETIPTSTITKKELLSNDKAAEALIWGMPAFLNKYASYGTNLAYDWGYGSLMHARDVMTADMAVKAHTYNWYTSWSSNTGLGSDYIVPYFIWSYYYQGIAGANEVINTLGKDAKGLKAGYLAIAYAFRSLYYLELAQSFEFRPNDVFGKGYTTDTGKSINYLTVPLITETTTDEETRNTPRATHEEIVAFIENDLTEASKIITNYERNAKTVPDLACVYGLLARLYMWDASYYNELDNAPKAKELYGKAKDAAREAINVGEGYSPMTESEWLDTKTGFNNINSRSWMWGSTTTSDDDVVHTGILNWTSWMSNEATFGYSSAGPYVMIGSNLYNGISDKDFRKLTFKAPSGSVLSGKEPIIVSSETDPNYMYGKLPEYASLKFRPGNGNVSDYMVAAACSYPLMRIEEMYFIEAEATTYLDIEKGRALLNDFMKKYRYSSYNFTISSEKNIVDEIIKQKRVEFFGEGITFFDYKRLNLSVDRTTSSNWDPTENFKTTGRPAWMTFTIPTTEVNNNPAMKGYENPDPSDHYTPVINN